MIVKKPNYIPLSFLILYLCYAKIMLLLFGGSSKIKRQTNN